MKADIHPDYVESKVTCACGAEFVTRSTKDEINVDVCSKCHPFYTNKQKRESAGGQIDKFKKRLEKKDGE